jgi:hypothetical protein
MHTTARTLLTLSLAVLPSAVAAQSLVPPEAARVELAAMWWQPEPAISIGSGALSSPIDFVNDLGIEKDRFREIRVVLKPGLRHKLRFSRVPVTYARQGQVIRRNVTFGGVTYPANVAVNSTFEWEFYRVGYEWDVVSARRAYLGLLVDLKYNKITTQLSSAVGTETTEVKVPVPTIGGIARVYLSDYISVTGEFTGLKLDRSEFRGKFYDIDAYGQLNFTRTFAAQVGYRSVTVDYRVDDDTGDLKLEGIYFGGVVRF